MNMPFCKFYPRDWMADLQVRSCSYAARGLWADILCLMSMNEDRRGYLGVGGRPITQPADIARFTVGDPVEVERLLAELQAAGVFSKDENGVIYCRRIVKDAGVSSRKRQAGKMGGNPRLLKHEVKQELNQVVNPLLKPRNQIPETRDQARPLTVSERIVLEKQIQIKEDEVRELEDQTSEQWQRDEHPEKVALKKQAKERLAEMKRRYMAL